MDAPPLGADPEPVAPVARPSAPRRSEPPAAPAELPRTGSAPSPVGRSSSAPIPVAREASAPIPTGRDGSGPAPVSPDGSRPTAVGRDPAAPDPVGRGTSRPIVAAREAGVPIAVSPESSSSITVQIRTRPEAATEPSREVPRTTRTPTGRVRRSRPPATNGPSGEARGMPSTRADAAAADGALADDIDAAFDQAQDQDADQTREGEVPNDAAMEGELHRLFGEIAAHHTQQLRDFAVELQHGEPGRKWAEICAPSVAMLCNGADAVGDRALAVDLRAFEQALERAMRGEPRIGGALRDELLERYRKLQRVLPEAFDLSAYRDRRDPVIVHALLAQVPGVHSLAQQKLYAAGLTGLQELYEATAEELGAVTGISLSVCQAIVARVARYREERAMHPPEEGHPRQRARLRAVIDTLEKLQADFLAADENEDKRRKRTIRRERDVLVAEIDLLLAEIGQAALASEMERYAIQRKIECVRAFLDRSATPSANRVQGETRPRG